MHTKMTFNIKNFAIVMSAVVKRVDCTVKILNIGTCMSEQTV